MIADMTVVTFLVGCFGALGTYLLNDIRDTLKKQAEHVGHIDSRVSKVEGILEVRRASDI